MFNRMMTGVIGNTVPIIINTNHTDWNLINEVFGGVAPTLAVKLVITNNAVIRASSTSVPAMDLRGLPAGSEIKLINNGYIIGKGGAGGKGESCIAYYL